MAKKKTANAVKVEETNKTEEILVQNTISEVQQNEIPLLEEKDNINDIDNLTIVELVSYEEACRMLCTHYDREMKLNELEKRNYTIEQIKHNREEYAKFVTIHRRLREIIENKVNKLTEYANW